jgi:transcriptional regulator with XRE-family HTH domain
MSTFSKRLKQARVNAKLSQEQLGLRVGLEPESASTRMNRYELAKRAPTYELVERIAVELDLPVAYFYANNDDEAILLTSFHKLDVLKQRLVMEFIYEIT